MSAQISLATYTSADYDTSIVGQQTGWSAEDEMAQSVLKGLKLVVVQRAKWARDADPIQRRRDDLAAKLLEQAQLFANPDHQRVVKKKGVETIKKIKRWWATNPDGSVVFSIKYGQGSNLEFAKGTTGIETKSDEVSDLINTLVQATRNGEFDNQMAAISSAISQKIQRKKTTNPKKKAA